MTLSIKRITKALIRLRGCAGWSAPVLFANPGRQVFSRRGPNGNSNKQRLNNKRINILERTIAKTTGAEGCWIQLGDNCIKNFHMGRYIVGYTVGNLVLRRRASGAVKRDIRTYIRRYTSPKENFEYGYPHSNALLQFEHKL